MKRFAVLFLTIVLIFLCACGTDAELTDEAKAICGSWAYIHDDATSVLQLKANGKAVFHDKNYTYNCDGGYIELLSSDGTQLRLRYVLDGEKLYLYEQTTYTYSGSGSPTGVVGMWEDKPDNWSFEFTQDGTFREDGYFPGRYSVNEADGTIKLMYNDHFEDTTVYYHVNGSELMIEYPWPMVPET